MKKKRSTAARSKLRNILENKGFYIALFSMIVLVGFSIYARKIQSEGANNSVSFDDDAWRNAVSENNIEIDGKVTANNSDRDDASETKLTENKTENQKNAPKETSASAEDSEESKSAAVETIAEAPVADGQDFGLQLPCSGKVIASCSIDDLVYCKAMDDWRTHNGMDIAAAEGDPVKAAASGVVSQVYEDDLLGVVVVLDHGNGVSSLYGNLQSYDFIRTGTEVKTGDIIGGVGKAGALETDLEPHLHFEVHKNGEYQDPTGYLKY